MGKNRDFSFRRPRRRRASPPGATKSGTFHSDGHGDCARLHRGPQKQGLFVQTAAATARVSTGGNNIRDFSFRRPRRLRASPPGATKTGTLHSDGHGDGARLHRWPQKQGLFIHTATATARVSTGGNKNIDFSLRRPRRLRASPPIICRRVAKPQSIIRAAPTPARLPSTSCRMLRASL